MIKNLNRILMGALILVITIIFVASLGVNMNNSLKPKEEKNLKIAVVFTGSGLGDKSLTI